VNSWLEDLEMLLKDGNTQTRDYNDLEMLLEDGETRPRGCNYMFAKILLKTTVHHSFIKLRTNLRVSIRVLAFKPKYRRHTDPNGCFYTVVIQFFNSIQAKTLRGQKHK